VRLPDPLDPGCPAALSPAYSACTGWSHFLAADRIPLIRKNAHVKKDPFRLTPYQVQWLLIVGFLTVGYAIYLRYLAVELSTVALACDAGLQTMLCKTRILATALFKNSVFGIAALVIAVLHLIRPSIVLLTAGVIAAGFGIVLYNIELSGVAIGLLILGFARPAPATA
jgi:prepilin signal peptidase PulO-like enzyme (type II secretory pathway)